VLPSIVVIIASWFTWRIGLGSLILPFLLLVIGLWIVVPRGQTNDSSALDSASLETLRYVWSGVTERTVLLLLLIQVLVVFTYHGFMGMYPTYLVESKGLSVEVATVLFGLFFALAILVQPLAGSLADLIGERYTLISVIIIACVGLVALPFVESLAVLTLLTVVLSAQHGRGVVAITYLTNELPDDMKGTGLGVIRTGYLLSGAVGPITLGVFADQGYFDAGFLLFGFVAFLGAVLCLLLPQRS
jgi:MFS family permease